MDFFSNISATSVPHPQSPPQFTVIKPTHPSKRKTPGEEEKEPAEGLMLDPPLKKVKRGRDGKRGDVARSAKVQEKADPAVNEHKAPSKAIVFIIRREYDEDDVCDPSQWDPEEKVTIVVLPAEQAVKHISPKDWNTLWGLPPSSTCALPSYPDISSVKGQNSKYNNIVIQLGRCFPTENSGWEQTVEDWKKSQDPPCIDGFPEFSDNFSKTLELKDLEEYIRDQRLNASLQQKRST